MKKIVLYLLAAILALLPVFSFAEDYTIIREIKTLDVHHVIKKFDAKAKMSTYYNTASECYNQKYKYMDTFYACAVLSAAYDILHQIPEWNIQLASNLVEDTAYFGYSDKDGMNDLVFIFYQGSGNYAIADYVVGERTLVLFNQAFSKEEIRNVLDQLCTKYTLVSQKELQSNNRSVQMVYNSIY